MSTSGTPITEVSDESQRKLRRSKSSIDFLLNDSDSKHNQGGEYGVLSELPKLSNMIPLEKFAPSEAHTLLNGRSMDPGPGQNFSSAIFHKPIPPGRSDGGRHFAMPIMLPPHHLHHSINPYDRSTIHLRPQFKYPFHQPPSHQQIFPVIPAADQHSFSNGDGDRQPQLKYSHKIAERKRRKDMNDTFDELKAVLHVQNAKMSKCDILTTAANHINDLQSIRQDLALERETLHRELGLPPKDLLMSQGP